MRASSLTTTALLAAPLASAHYIFSQLIVNGQAVGSDYSYIRKNTNTYMPSFTDEVIDSEDLRCNKGATNAASETYDVNAGDTVGFKLAYNEFIEHPGPGFVYMSLADGGDVSSYDGSGDWFKVWESGLSGSASEDSNWGTWQADQIEFNIPTDIPDGEYLVRPEHIGVHEGHVGKAQFYMECAQLRISGGGSGTPGPLVKIPGLYTPEEVNFDKWSSPAPTSYTMPGPAVWTGGGSSGASPAAGNSTDGEEADSSSEVTPSSAVGSAPEQSAPAQSPPAQSPPAQSPPAQSPPAQSPPAWGQWGAAWPAAAPSTLATVASRAAPTASAVAYSSCG